MEILVSEFPIPGKSVKGKSCTHTCWETAELRNTHIYICIHAQKCMEGGPICTFIYIRVIVWSLQDGV